MELELREDGRVTVILLKGALTIGDAEATFKKTVTRLLEEGHVDLLVDCSGLTIVDSAGLGSLVRALTTSQNEGGKTKLLGVGPRLQTLLAMTKLDSVFEMHTDLESALQSF